MGQFKDRVSPLVIHDQALIGDQLPSGHLEIGISCARTNDPDNNRQRKMGNIDGTRNKQARDFPQQAKLKT